MKRKDLLWALAYPVYQIIGTLRHEGSHALAAMAEGAKVTKSVFWPNFHLGGTPVGICQLGRRHDLVYDSCPVLL
jgi:hypothetical protein